MKKEVLVRLIIENHDGFITKIEHLTDMDFMRSPGPKWSAGQQLEHILKSIRRTHKAFSLPLSVLKTKFGLSKEPSITYKELVFRYLNILELNKNYQLPEEFFPHMVPIEKKQQKLKELRQLVHALKDIVDQYNEKNLDAYRIPHPVMGKLTLREMLYFTAYHVKHHDKQVLKNLELFQS
ncbi:MAG: DinB family protein [Bacteroidota bacterium]